MFLSVDRHTELKLPMTFFFQWLDLQLRSFLQGSFFFVRLIRFCKAVFTSKQNYSEKCTDIGQVTSKPSSRSCIDIDRRNVQNEALNAWDATVGRLKIIYELGLGFCKVVLARTQPTKKSKR